MTSLTAVSLFAGIGGIDLALDRAGVRVVAAVEIDPDCRGILRRHFPGTAIFSDVTEVTGEQLRAAGFVPGRGILAGGFPCQDLSVAGRRAGLGGARSGLFWHVMRLADELRPRWLLLENVPGLLSSVCSCPGDGTCAGNGRALECGEWRLVSDVPDERVTRWFPDVPHTVRGGACATGCMAAHGGAMGAVLGALGERGYGFAYRVLDAQFFGVPQRRRRVFIAGCLGDRAAPVQVLLESEGGEGNPAEGGQAGPGTPAASHGGAVSALQGGGRRGHRVDAEGAAGGHLIAIPVAWRGREGGSQAEAGRDGDPMFALRASRGGGTGGMPMVATLGGQGVDHALTSEGADASEDGTGRGTPIVAYALTSHHNRDSDSDSGQTYVTTPAIAAVSENQRGEIAETPYSHQLTTGGGKPGQGYGAVRQDSAVRRLTPRECERLQGLSDDWTRWPDDGSEQSDSARYRQLGNTVAVPVVEWITRRLAAVEAHAEAGEVA